METFLSIIGLSLNIIGTIILAYSLSSYIRSMRLAIDANYTSILSFSQNNLPKIVISGTDKHMDNDKKNSGLYTRIGVILILIGFVFQLIAIFAGKC